MKRKILLYSIPIILTVFVISGCSTVPKKYKEEMSGMKTRVDTLESKVDTVEARQADVERATSRQGQAIEGLTKGGRYKQRAGEAMNFGVKPKAGRSKDKTRLIQTCLKNAGFYSGSIDGIKGKKTRRAIKEFQKASGLKADGIVGQKTWDMLGRYASTQPLGEGATK